MCCFQIGVDFRQCLWSLKGSLIITWRFNVHFSLLSPDWDKGLLSQFTADASIKTLIVFQQIKCSSEFPFVCAKCIFHALTRNINAISPSWCKNMTPGVKPGSLPPASEQLWKCIFTLCSVLLQAVCSDFNKQFSDRNSDLYTFSFCS